MSMPKPTPVQNATRNLRPSIPGIAQPKPSGPPVAAFPRAPQTVRPPALPAAPPVVQAAQHASKGPVAGISPAGGATKRTHAAPPLPPLNRLPVPSARGVVNACRPAGSGANAHTVGPPPTAPLNRMPNPAAAGAVMPKANAGSSAGGPAQPPHARKIPNVGGRVAQAMFGGFNPSGQQYGTPFFSPMNFPQQSQIPSGNNSFGYQPQYFGGFNFPPQQMIIQPPQQVNGVDVIVKALAEKKINLDGDWVRYFARFSPTIKSGISTFASTQKKADLNDAINRAVTYGQGVQETLKTALNASRRDWLDSQDEIFNAEIESYGKALKEALDIIREHAMHRRHKIPWDDIKSTFAAAVERRSPDMLNDLIVMTGTVKLGQHDDLSFFKLITSPSNAANALHTIGRNPANVFWGHGKSNSGHGSSGYDAHYINNPLSLPDKVKAGFDALVEGVKDYKNQQNVPQSSIVLQTPMSPLSHVVSEIHEENTANHIIDAQLDLDQRKKITAAVYFHYEDIYNRLKDVEPSNSSKLVMVKGEMDAVATFYHNNLK